MFFLFSKAFRTDKCGKLIQSISQRAKRTGITAKMTSEQNGNDQQQCRDIQKGVPGYALLSSDCKKDRFYSCKCSRKKRWRCYKKYKLYGGTDQPYLSLFLFHAFSAFDNASFTASKIPVELKVAPEMVSTSVLCSLMMLFMTFSPCDR